MAARQAFVEPVRTGRPRVEGLSPTVARLMVASLASIVAMLVWRLLSEPLPDHIAAVGDLASQALSILMVFICMHVASYGLSWRWRLPVWIILALMHTMAGTVYIAGSLNRAPTLAVVAFLVGLGGTILLLVGTVIQVLSDEHEGRGGATVTIIAGSALSVGPCLFMGLTSPDPRIQDVTSAVFLPFFFLPALGLALAGSVSLASLTTNVALWSALSLREGHHAPLLRRAWIVVAVLSATGGALSAFLDRAPLPTWGTATGVVCVGGLLAWLAVVRSQRHGASRPPFLSDLSEHLSEVAIPLGVLLGLVAAVIPSALLLSVTQPGTVLDEIPTEVPRLVVDAASWGHGAAGVLTLVTGFVLARRGRIVSSTLFGAVSICFLAVALAGDSERFELSSGRVATVLASVIIVVAAITAARGKMDELRWTAALIGQILCTLWPWYPDLLEPLGLLADSHGLAVLVVGLLWFLATEAEGTHRSTPSANRTARSLLFCAHAGMLILLAFLVDDVLGPAYWETFDDSLMTSAVPIAATAMLLDFARWHIDPDPRVPFTDQTPPHRRVPCPEDL